MAKNVFDQVARDYEKIHNQSLPPGVHSVDFIRQRAACVTRWICEAYSGKEFCYLDFGCGNGRMLKFLLDSDALKPLLEQTRLKLFGFDTSVESVNEAESLLGDARVCLVSDLNQLPGEVRFDFVISCHVFHHIPPAERAETVERLASWMNPSSRLVIWEHNPFNPITRLLVNACPFDDDARLLTLNTTKTLFGKSLFRYREHAYVNLFPPRWLRFDAVSAIEVKLSRLPIGAQYWVMFESDE
ncbi:MAG TPA: class I SAM-dependent methyltransferase [Desulfobacterales bacterium]|nr:class I SAM-dependent methyltransferase [Desulfobacterales bacterium]